MTSNPTVTPFFGHNKIGFQIEGTDLLTTSPHLKKYPRVANSMISEGNLSPVGAAMLHTGRQCAKKISMIESISIGPRNVVIRFASQGGSRKWAQEYIEHSIRKTLRQLQTTQPPISNAQPTNPALPPSSLSQQ